MCHRLLKAEAELTEADIVCGDGDCGLTLISIVSLVNYILLFSLVLKFQFVMLRITIARTARHLLANLAVLEAVSMDSASFVEHLAELVNISGGSLGALSEILLRSMARSLADSGMDGVSSSQAVWSKALLCGIKAIETYGKLLYLSLLSISLSFSP